jgi:hypothetical protein
MKKPEDHEWFAKPEQPSTLFEADSCVDNPRAPRDRKRSAHSDGQIVFAGLIANRVM